MHSARQFLRAATAADHRRVDRAYAGFDLADPGAYAAFLAAHARALAPLERAIALAFPWPAWQSRWPALARDLDDLGSAAPQSEALGTATPPDAPAIWGMLYVIEGSRLGGAVLAARVGPGLPRRYLAGGPSADGSWMAFQGALQAAAPAADPAWLDRAVAGARLAFRRFEASAMLQMEAAGER